MNPSKRVKSIARRIQRAWSRKLFRTYLIIDVIVITLAVVGFCYAAELAAGGAAEDSYRAFHFAPGAFDFLSPDAGVFARIREWLNFSAWGDALSTMRYEFMPYHGVMQSVSLDRFLTVLGRMLVVLLMVELVLWIFGRLFGRGGARRALKPLDRMTETAQQLSTAPPTEASMPVEDRLHNLEDAISSLSPELHGTRLSTGNEDLKGLEEAINNLLTRMQHAYREQARFVSDASHELRTPIAVIQGYASMLDRWGKQDESILDESIAAIKSEADHMKALIEQLLFLARGDNGRQTLTLKPFDLTEMMREVHDEYELIDPLHKWRLHVGGPVMTVGDEGMLKQVARILSDNAIKYTPAGGLIDLTVIVKDGVPGFSVQDTGSGIPPEALPQIFERFFRADPSRAAAKPAATDRAGKPGAKRSAGPVSSTGGTGLGLSIAEWIVKRHNGYFEVLSKPDLGTRVTVWLTKEPGDAAHDGTK